MKINKLWFFIPFIMVAGCSIHKNEPTYKALPYQESMIGLQDLQSRTLVYCYASKAYTVEQCARKFEEKGFVRLTNIPRFPAQYDTLKADTYPTRRWRKDEKIPRW